MTTFPYNNDSGFNLDSWNPLVNHVRDLKPGKWQITVEKPKRSSAQNRRYWPAIIEIFRKELGYTKDEMHQLLASKFLSYDKKLRTGKVHRFVRSTSDLNTKEFSEYCDNCEEFGSREFGIVFPEEDQLEDYLRKCQTA